MHGRLKVKTSEQQAAEKKAARQEKMRIYQGAMANLLHHRADHCEAQLKMTSGILLANPDITTLWNIRKEALLHLLKECQDDASRDARLSRDMDMSVDCLVANPKSYGAWHHRCWCLLLMSKPDWNRELNLCNKYLALDERNFHVWDYRKFIIAQAGIPAKDELDYTSERIHANFSNYSAWHYRSKLLPKVFPESDGDSSSGKMSEMKRREELDLVQNAAFTDPDDSSAWFYYKWLLLGGKAFQASPKPVFLSLDRTKNQLILALSAPLNANQHCRVSFNAKAVTDLIVNAEWKAASPDQLMDTLWTMALDNQEADMVVVKVEPPGWEISVSNTNPTAWLEQHERKILEPQTLEVLHEELENCSALLEMEPESKWTRYMRIVIMQALSHDKDASPELKSKVLDEFRILAKMDTNRQGYYDDMFSREILQTRLSLQPEVELDLANLGLSSIYFKERLALVHHLNLAGNRLRGVDALLPYLVHLRTLNLDSNPIKSLDGLEWASPELCQVSIRSTPISENPSDVQSLQRRFPSIAFVI